MRKRTKRCVAGLMAALLACLPLAGCGGGKEEGSEGGDVATALEVQTKLTDTKLEGDVDENSRTLKTVLTFTPEPAGHGHPYVEGGPDWSTIPFLYEYLTDYGATPESRFEPQLLESFEQQDKVLTLKLREGLQYNDGTPINADELLNNFYMDLSTLNLLTYAEAIEKVDDLTVKITYKEVSDMITTNLLKSQMIYSVAEYGKWAEVYKDLFENERELDEKEGTYKWTEAGQKKYDETALECNSYLPKMTEIKTSGPYMISTVTSDEITLTANPNYRNELPIDTIVGIRQSSSESLQIAVQNGDLDIENSGLSTDLAMQIAKSNAETIRQVGYSAYSQWGLCFNVAKAPTDKLEVRQAIAYIVDTDQIAPATEPGMMVADKYATVLPLALRDKYLSSDQLSKMTEYNLNLEKAEELLKSVGWSKSGGQWVDENGQTPEIIIGGIGSYQISLITGEAVANMLQEFGIKASFVSQEASAYNDYAQSGQAHIIIDNFGGANGAQHPIEAYGGIYWYGTRMGLSMTPPAGEKLTFKDEVTGEDFCMDDVISELKLANGDEEMSAVCEKLAVFFNHNMWYLPVTDQCYVVRVYNDKLSMPSVPTGQVVNDFYWCGTLSVALAKMIHSGELYFVK